MMRDAAKSFSLPYKSNFFFLRNRSGYVIFHFARNILRSIFSSHILQFRKCISCQVLNQTNEKMKKRINR